MGLAAEEVELGGQPAAAAANVGVDALAVVAQSGNRGFVQRRELGFGRAAKADDAAESVDVERDGTKELGQLSQGDAAVLVHLPEPVLGVNEPLCAPEVGLRLGVEVGNAVLVAQDLDGRVQLGQLQFAPVLGRGPLNQPPVDVDNQSAAEKNENEEDGEGEDDGNRVHGLAFVAFHWTLIPLRFEFHCLTWKGPCDRRWPPIPVRRTLPRF